QYHCLPVALMVRSGVGTSSWVNNSRNDGIAIATRIITGTMVHITSSSVLCVVRDGVGLLRTLKRRMMIRSRIRTKAVIAEIIQSKKVWKLMTSAMTGDAASCRPICQGVG